MYCYQLHNDGYFQDGILIFAFRGFQSKDVPRLLSSIEGSHPRAPPRMPVSTRIISMFIMHFGSQPRKNPSLCTFALLIGWGFSLQSLRWIRWFLKMRRPKSTFTRFPSFQPLPRHKADMNQVMPQL